MTNITSDRRIWAGLAALLIIMAVLAFRSQQAASSVLSYRSESDVPVVATGGDPHGLLGLARRDSLLEIAQAAKADPFHNKNFTQDVARQTPRKKSNTPARRKMPEPKLLTLLHDDVNPCVQINVGGNRSGWLHNGDSFQGWSVNEITRDGVTVAKRSKTLVLR
jgi:hypothetical protein